MSGARFWPTPAQGLLLAVCLRREPEAARQAWREWKAMVDLDDLDPASFQIMSLVSLRLLELGISDPDSGRIKGLHRYSWTQNQVAFRGRSALLKSLHAIKIPTMLLGGAALARTVYPEPAARGLSDTQILVPVEDVPRAIQLLAEQGWSTRQFDPVETVRQCPSYPLLHAEHGEVPLYWRVLPRPSRNGQDAWWRAAQSFAFEQIPTHLPAPADHFLHACAAPLRHSSAAGLQWLADCTLLIRQSGMRLDWLRLVKQAQRFQLTLHTRATLLFLQRNFEDSIPGEVIAELHRSSVALENHLEYFVIRRAIGKQNDFTHKLATAARRYLLLKEGSWLAQFFGDLPRFFRFLLQKFRRRPQLPE